MSVLRKLVYATAVGSALALSVSHAEITNDAVKIGLLTDYSGPYAHFAGTGSEIAARMAIEDFGGKVSGLPIVLLTADHQNKPAIAAAKAREWVDQEDVDVFLEMINSGVALAVNDVAGRREKVALVIGGGTSQLTNEQCTPGTVHWVYDTYAMATGTANALSDEGHDKWFFITADYAFGHALQNDVTRVVEARGGEVVGAIRHPHPTVDFSSYVLQAQNSGAGVIALANAGPDFTNAVRAAGDFGISGGSQQVAGMIATLTDIHALGLEAAQGLYLTTGFYWDMDEQTREWSQRFFEKAGHMPNMFHAGTYSALTHYLKGVEKADSDEQAEVMQAMRDMPINDFFARNGTLRKDGRMVYDMYLAQVKTPAQSKAPWDYYRIVRTIEGEQAYLPLSESRCALVTD